MTAVDPSMATRHALDKQQQEPAEGGLDVGAAEAKVAAFLERQLQRLADAGRCDFRREVRMLAWTHSKRGHADTLRIDFVACLDGGPLIGFEVKRQILRAADLGRALVQCGQYAAGHVAGSATTPNEWVGRPLKAVFLAMDRRGLDMFVARHVAHAERLFAPANVGFATFKPQTLTLGGTYGASRTELRLNLAAERWWSERYGYRADALSKANRRGNGSFRQEDVA